LVAKVVQGIANENTEFNEAYMNQIQDLLLKYIEKLHKFYDRVTVRKFCSLHMGIYPSDFNRKIILAYCSVSLYNSRLASQQRP
jgi:hypothetical protein